MLRREKFLFKYFMKRLILFAILFYAVIFLYIEFFGGFFHSYTFSFWKYQKEVVKTAHSPAAKLLFSGDSRTMTNIIPSMFTKTPGLARSIALDGASPIDTYYSLKYYLENNPAPKTLFFAISSWHLGKADWFWARTVKLKYLKLTDYFEVFEKSIELDDYPYEDFRINPGHTKVKKEEMPYEIYKDFWLFYLNYPYYYQSTIMNAKMFLRYNQNQKNYKEVSDGLGHSLLGTRKGTNGISISNRRKNFEASKVLDYYLRKMMDICRQNRIRLIFKSMPINQKTMDRLNPQHVKEYREYLDGLQKDYPEFEIRGEYYGYDNKFFGDPYHLNYSGAVKLSNEIKQEFNLEVN